MQFECSQESSSSSKYDEVHMLHKRCINNDSNMGACTHILGGYTCFFNSRGFTKLILQVIKKGVINIQILEKATEMLIKFFIFLA